MSVKFPPLLTDQDAKLFGVLWPLTHHIKLDPTVDRTIFRQQRDRLKALGYGFKPVGQLWESPNLAAACC